MKNVILLILFVSIKIYAQLNANFQDNQVANFDSPMGVVFDKNGQMYVYERAGKVFVYTTIQNPNFRYISRGCH